MKTQWRNVSGQFNIEITMIGNGKVFDVDGNEINFVSPCLQSKSWIRRLANSLLRCHTPVVEGELTIDFLSSGFNDPGSMYGGPDNLGYPPEGDDERLYDDAYVTTCDGDTLQLTKEVGEQLFDFYTDQIHDIELECDYDYHEDW